MEIFKGRIQHKTDTNENWSKAKNFIPLKGELIIYSDLRKIKIGDGINVINNLDFASADQIGELTQEGGIIFNDLVTNAATAEYASAFGSETVASGKGAIATGTKQDRSGAPEPPTDADWRYTTAAGEASMASGMGAVAFSRASKSLGYRTQTGYPKDGEKENYPTVNGYVHAPDTLTDKEKANVNAGNYGQAAVAIGSDTKALANNAFAAGYKSIASNAQTIAMGTNAEATGLQAIAIGTDLPYEDSEGRDRVAKVSASGRQSIAIGTGAQATAERAVSIGFRTTADQTGQVVLGRLNEPDIDAVFIIGTGTSEDPDGDDESRYNSLVIDQQNKFTINSNNLNLNALNNIDMYCDNTANLSCGILNVDSTGDILARAEGKIKLQTADETGEMRIQTPHLAFGDSSVNATGTKSIAIGANTSANGAYSVASGNKNSANANYSFAFGQNCNTNGNSSVAIGSQASADGLASIAMGSGVTAGYEIDATTGEKITSRDCNYSVAMGEGSKAHGRASTSVGHKNIARGLGAFASGVLNIADGYASTAMGRNNVATAKHQVVIGQYNNYENGAIDNAIFVVANGTSAKRANAFVVEDDGTIMASGDIYTNGKIVATKQYVGEKLAEFVDSAPETLNTLNELAAALGDDPNFATTVATQIGNVEKEVNDDQARIIELENQVTELQNELAKVSEALTQFIEIQNEFLNR